MAIARIYAGTLKRVRVMAISRDGVMRKEMYPPYPFFRLARVDVDSVEISLLYPE